MREFVERLFGRGKARAFDAAGAKVTDLERRQIRISSSSRP